MKQTFLIIIGLLMTVLSSNAQTLRGTLIDENKQPLAYANVVLQTADSVYVAGTVSKANGQFEIAMHENARLVNISFVGYNTIIQEIDQYDLGVIQLLPDAQVLGEVTVKGYLPKTQVKGDAMVTTVSGTLLEKAGTAENLLDKIPNVTAQDGAVTVFGRGTPEIYINGRKVRNSQELDQLSSDHIKSVEVVSNPGARYDTSVKAVIRIITKKMTGEGIGIDNRTVARHKRDYGWSVYDQLNLNYRKNGLDVSGMLYAGDFKSGNDQTFMIDTYLDKHWLQNLDLSDQRFKSQSLESTVLVNYQFNENHTMGARYNFERTPKDYDYINQYAQTYCEGGLYEDLFSMITANNPETYHRSNFYYNGKIKQWSIDFNADGLWSDSKITQLTEEDIKEGSHTNEDRHVTTQSTESNELYASKLVISRPVGKGELSFGGEYSHNKRNTTYFNEEGILENDLAMIKEDATSAFIEYSLAFNKLQVQAGLRYEHTGFDYYDNGEYMSQQSKNYNHVFPSVSLGFPIKEAQLQLSYSSDISRPAYWDLRSNTTYVNRYMYSKGNPFLMPSVTHNIALNGSYKWVNLYLGYSHIKDAITSQTIAYSEDNPTIGVLTSLNVPAYDTFLASLNFSPTFGCWRPQIGLGLRKQWYEGETPKGKERFNKPMGSITFNNNFKLPKGFLLDLNGSWTTKGHSENIYVEKDMIDLSASLYKSFLKDNLTIQLRAFNLFESKQVVTAYSGIRVMYNTLTPHRQITCTLRYKFNNTKSKYKGTGAGESQKSRM